MRASEIKVTRVGDSLFVRGAVRTKNGRIYFPERQFLIADGMKGVEKYVHDVLPPRIKQLPLLPEEVKR